MSRIPELELAGELTVEVAFFLLLLCIKFLVFGATRRTPMPFTTFAGFPCAIHSWFQTA